MKAIWNGKIIAESDKTIKIEGNEYFPPESVKKEFLSKSETNTVCHWKGTASYYNVFVDGKTNADAAWHYPEPKPMVEEIKDFIAFWRSVRVTK